MGVGIESGNLNWGENNLEKTKLVKIWIKRGNNSNNVSGIILKKLNLRV